MDPDWRMYFLLNMGIFHCYVSLPEGIFWCFWWFGTVCNAYVTVMYDSVHLFQQKNAHLFQTTLSEYTGHGQPVGCPGVIGRWDCCDVERAWEIQSSFPIGVRRGRRGDAWCIEPKDGNLLVKHRSGSQLSVLYRVHAVATIAAPRLWPINVFRGESCSWK